MKLFTKIRKKGQALVLVTLGLFAMCGLLGLAVDLGWSFFVKRAAQSAADAAAIAAVEDALQRQGASMTWACGSALTCQSTPADCPSTIPSPPGTNLEVGCAYAVRNGFTVGGNGGRQNVTIQANVSPTMCADVPPPNCVPTAPGVEARYWVTVRITERIPQLFSAIFGNTEAVAAARATAAIVNSIVIGSLILTNRQNEEMNTTGMNWVTQNLSGGGGANVSVPGGVLLASNCSTGTCGGTNNAGHLSGNTRVDSPFTFVRTGGVACAGNIPGCAQTGNSSWISPYQNRQDGGMFMDPMRGKGQPPLTTTPLQPRPIGGGVISGGTAQNPTLLYPGQYYATEVLNPNIANGQKIQLANGYFKFVPDSGAPGTGFGDYIFWGGLSTGGGNTTVTFNPGRYVFAGQSSGDGGSLVFLSNGTTLNDYSTPGQQNSDPGEILIFTDRDYPGLNIQLGHPLMGPVRNFISNNPLTAYQFGQSGFTMGQNDSSTINLHGLNDKHPLIQATALEDFSPVVLWQDQRNSRVRHLPDGQIDISCGDLDNPCTNDPPRKISRAMNIQATPASSLYGAVYQPRGAWLNLTGGAGYSGPLQLITGAVNLQGNPGVTLQSVGNPITRRVAALVGFE